MGNTANLIDWQSGLKDAMWSMFWFKENADDRDFTESDKEAVKENVARLIRMTTQKNAGQRGVKDCLDWRSLDTTIMTIICAVTSLCLSGYFGDMPEFIEGDETNGKGQDFDMRGRICTDSSSVENVGQECSDDSGLDSQRKNKSS